jgi:hypothetical protein
MRSIVLYTKLIRSHQCVHYIELVGIIEFPATSQPHDFRLVFKLKYKLSKNYMKKKFSDNKDVTLMDHQI